MKSNHSFTLITLLLFTAAIVFTSQTIVDSKATDVNLVISMLSQDISLSDKQKADILSKTTILATNKANGNNSSSTDSSKITFKTIYMIALDSVLTTDQLNVLKAKQEVRMKAVAEEYRKKK